MLMPFQRTIQSVLLQLEPLYEAGKPIRYVYFPETAVRLEGASCECYHVPSRQFEHLLPTGAARALT